MTALRRLFWRNCACLFSLAPLTLVAQGNGANAGSPSPNHAFYRSIHLVPQTPRKVKPIRIAVIDMGFRTTHKSIRKYILQNTAELPGNQTDDDRNGYPDDVMGWDVADDDNDVSIRKGMEDELYHGTYITSIIVSTLEEILGPDAAKFISIIPIKAYSENNKSNKLRDAYKGFAYAKAMQADVICCAWAGGLIKEDETAAVRALLQDGKIIVAASGNFMTERVETPASIAGVIAVSAVDSLLRKTGRSNYGMRVDLSAPGENIYGAHPDADNAFIKESGTSASTAIVTGMAAALKVLSPGSGSFEIREALLNTAQPIDQHNLPYAGKLGAGIPDFEKALRYLQRPRERHGLFDPQRPEGRLITNGKADTQHWSIRPAGVYKGLHLMAMHTDDPSMLTVRNADSLVFEGRPNDLNRVPILPGISFDIEYKPRGAMRRRQSFSYSMETMDSAKLYCPEKKTLMVDSTGFIEDGSGASDYANFCECTWKLIAPPGKRIRFEMMEMDTEPLVDYIWFFNGMETHEDNLFAKLSGTTPAPVIESSGNEVLVWFLTDKFRTGKGWKLRYQVW